MAAYDPTKFPQKSDNIRDLEGLRFTKLRVIAYGGINGKHYWVCRCDCGKWRAVRVDHLLRGKTTGCGCGRHKTIPESFLERVVFGNPDECWPWRGSLRRARGPGGWGNYGQLRHYRGNYAAHRLAWEILRGPIPEWMNVLHKCDNPPCCNPAHLYLGTWEENNRDMLERGRWNPVKIPKGEAHPDARLTEDDVRNIRRLVASGTPQATVARMFRIGSPHVSRIYNRKKWTHVA